MANTYVACFRASQQLIRCALIIQKLLKYSNLANLNYFVTTHSASGLDFPNSVASSPLKRVMNVTLVRGR